MADERAGREASLGGLVQRGGNRAWAKREREGLGKEAAGGERAGAGACVCRRSRTRCIGRGIASPSVRKTTSR
eukprot:4659611-Pleurochrysis_carterae.AAC.2